MVSNTQTRFIVFEWVETHKKFHTLTFLSRNNMFHNGANGDGGKKLLRKREKLVRTFDKSRLNLIQVWVFLIHEFVMH